ncbi:hypothetical protein [Gillisia sp. Hel_I_86]|uniref:hypothetical protein n=1 Tax=Gillisia sp. Hel_I_86 TaxID=1249981 RepID=UPI0028F734D6|nr:hypothetical protein [Gillisia sp. Hel_I_86]
MHSMRKKMRSGGHTYSNIQNGNASKIIENLQPDFKNKLIAQVYPFRALKASREELHNYYRNDPQKPFRKSFIAPKLKVLL